MTGHSTANASSAGAAHASPAVGSGTQGVSRLQHAGAFGLLLVTAFLWSTTGAVAALIPRSVSGFTIGASTLGIGGLLMLLVYWRSTFPALRDPSIRHYILIGGIGVFVYALSYYSSMRLAGVAIGSLVNLGSAPVFAMLIERVLDGRIIPLRRWIGIAIAGVGLVLTSLNVRKPGTGVDGLPLASNEVWEVVLGVGLALAAGFLYAMFTSTAQRAMRIRPDSSGVMGAIFGVGGILLLPVVLFTGAGLLESPRTFALAAYLAVVPVFLAMWMFAVALRTIAASTAIIATLIEPVLASLLAVVVVHERIFTWGWAGIAAVVVGLLLATRE